MISLNRKTIDSANLTEYTKQDTVELKGYALLLMFIHHLFGSMEQYSYFTTWLPKNVIIWFGLYAQICVGLFLFLSGIGMFYSAKGPKRTFARVFSLYIKMWMVMVAVCIPVKWLTNGFSFNLMEFIKNLLALNTSYCGSWWFVLLYAEVMVAFAILAPVLSKGKLWDTIILAGTVITAVFCKWFADQTGGALSTIFIKINEFTIYFPNFLLGYYCSKYNLPNRFLKWLENKNKPIASLLAISVILASVVSFAYLRGYISILYQDYYLVPLFAFSALAINKLIKSDVYHRIIGWVGAHSVWLWLLHSIFIRYLHNVVYMPHYALFILVWLLVLQLPAVFIFSWCYKHLVKL